MDLRTKKTQHSIFNAFLELRARYPLEKITVKELCSKADIHKSTFYAHYQDLYDLADTLETEVVDQVLDSIQNPEYALERPAEFIRELFRAYHARDPLIQTLFSGSRSGQLIEKTESGLHRLIFQRRPEYQNNADLQILLSCMIYGGYHAYLRNRECGMERVAEVLGRLAEEAQVLFPPFPPDPSKPPLTSE